MSGKIHAKKGQRLSLPIGKSLFGIKKQYLPPNMDIPIISDDGARPTGEIVLPSMTSALVAMKQSVPILTSGPVYTNNTSPLDMSQVALVKKQAIARPERYSKAELDRHTRKFIHVMQMGARSPRRYWKEQISAGADPNTFPSLASLRRWKAIAAADPDGLAGYHYRAGRSIQVENGPLLFFFDCKTNRKDASGKKIYELMRDRKDSEGWGELHALCTYKRWYNELPASLRAQLEGGSRQRFEKAGPVLPQPEVSVNHTWQCDAKQFPVYVMDLVDGKIYRPWIVAFIDCASRMIMGWTVTRDTPTTRDVLLALKHALSPADNKRWFGRPKIIQTDNAQIFRARDFRGALFMLHIAAKLIAPHSPSENCKIEAFNGTLQGEFLGAFKQEVIRKSKLHDRATFHEIWSRFPDAVSKFVSRYCLEHEHQGIDRSTPFQFWRDGVDVASVEFDRTSILRAVTVSRSMVVAPRGIEVIAGSGRFYTSVEMNTFTGRRVVVTYPPEGPGQQILAFHRQRFIGFLRCPKDDPTLAHSIKALDMDKLAAEIQLTKLIKNREESELRKAAKAALRANSKPPTKGNRGPSKSKAADAADPDSPIIADSVFPELPVEEN